MQLVLVLDSAFDIGVSKVFIPLFSLRLKFLTWNDITKTWFYVEHVWVGVLRWINLVNEASS